MNGKSVRDMRRFLRSKGFTETTYKDEKGMNPFTHKSFSIKKLEDTSLKKLLKLMKRGRKKTPHFNRPYIIPFLEKDFLDRLNDFHVKHLGKKHASEIIL